MHNYLISFKRISLISNLLLVLLLANAFSEEKLDPNNRSDDELLKIVNTDLDPTWASYPIILLKEKTIFDLKDNIVFPQTGDKKEVTHTWERQLVSYINSEKGTGWGNFSTGYEPGKSEVEIVTGRRIRSDGTYLSITPEDITDQAVDSDPDIINYENNWEKSFSLKDVRKGDFLEYKTKTTSYERMGPTGFGSRYYFGGYGKPVVDEEVCFSMNKDIPFYFKLIDHSKSVEIRESANLGNKKTYCFNWKNGIPEIFEKDTPLGIYKVPVLFVSTWGDSFEGWEVFENWLSEKYKGKYEPNEEIKGFVSDLTEGLSKEDSIAKIFHWIEKNVRYVQVYLRMDSGFVPVSGNEVFHRRFGDCKEKTTLFITMLRVLGVDAYPAFIGTTNTLPADINFPFMYQFDHMITYLDYDGTSKFLDPVGTTMPYPHLLDMDLNRNVLVFKNGKFLKTKTRTPLKNSREFLQESTVKINLYIEDPPICSVTIGYDTRTTYRGKSASDWHAYGWYSQTDFDDFMYNQYMKDATINTYKFENKLGELDLPVILDMNYSKELDTVCYGSNKPSSIMLPKFLEIVDEKYFKKFAKKRSYPFVWYDNPFSKRTRYEITIPDEYKLLGVSNVPTYDGEIFSYDVKFDIQENQGEGKLLVEETLIIKKPILTPEEFKEVAEVLKNFSKILSSRLTLMSKSDL